jgi:acetyl-CoA carboxylase biotin carboxyl carrier protein
MDINEIRKLVKLVETSGINELEIQEENLQIRITKGQASEHVHMPQIIHAPAAASPNSVEVATDIREARIEAAASGDKNTVEILSPMVGTYYHAASPDAAAFIKEGDVILPGQILCIIEAMKLMNEIEAEISGKIVKLLVENAQPVEFNQPLFLVEKS